MPSFSSRARPTLQLQSKVLLLVLLPLLIVSMTLVSIASYNRLKGTEATLAKQRETLIEAREKEMRSVVQAARSAIAPIVADAGPDDSQAKAQARDILRSISFNDGNNIFAYDYQGTNLVSVPMPEREGTDMLDAQDEKGKYLVRDMIDMARSGGGYYQYHWPHPQSGEVEPKHSYVTSIDKWGWMLGAGVYVADIEAAMDRTETFIMGKLRRSMLASAGIALGIFLTVAALAYWLTRRTVLPLRRATAAMQDIAAGKGDLTRRLAVESRDETGELAIQFNAFIERMQHTLRKVRTTTASVDQAAGSIAQSSEELASRTEQSAANLQQTSASMEEITSTVNHSAEAAQQANQLVQSTADVARQGEAMMGRVEKTMDDINASADKIGEIIAMIDAIAFQTNILALNASVEAARAGEHGRGFAVVAEEVRTLAGRSGNASREIRELIDSSAAHTRSGAELVRDTGRTMQEIVASVDKVTDVIGEISAGAREQSSGISQVNTAVTEMDGMTQQNAAMVQQASSAATDLRRQVQQLTDLINSFVLGESTQGAVAVTPPSAAPVKRPERAKPQAMRRDSVSEDVDAWSEF